LEFCAARNQAKNDLNYQILTFSQLSLNLGISKDHDPELDQARNWIGPGSVIQNVRIRMSN
jgi:hypothetical protein